MEAEDSFWTVPAGSRAGTGWRHRRLVLALSFVLGVAPAVCGQAASVEPPGSFQPTKANPAGPQKRPPAGMVRVPGGEFSMGCAAGAAGLCRRDSASDDRPIHRVYVEGFWMDRTAVTNQQFAEFVKATSYVTMAERSPGRTGLPTALAVNIAPGSTVFHPTKVDGPPDDFRAWWHYEPGADWRHPTGPQSTIDGRGGYPVVQVAYPDAAAYARWADKRLPSEAEWEFAARGGLAGELYPWGSELTPRGQWMANVWQGAFPGEDTGRDGFAGLAPVAKYPPNAYGLYDMAGNVWEWCADWYRADYYRSLAGGDPAPRNPQGPPDSLDPEEPAVPKRVQRGGSFLCSDQYCTRYVVGSRGKGDPDTASNHLGFRCVADLKR